VVSVVLTFGQTRYRSTFEVALVILAAVSLERLWSGAPSVEPAPAPASAQASPPASPPAERELATPASDCVRGT
jgi:hypothetical protein